MTAHVCWTMDHGCALHVNSAGDQTIRAINDTDKARNAERFRTLALPHLDDVYTLARYLLKNPTDAEDAAQECFLRAFRHFDTFRGGPIKPWLMAILRNVCRAEYARRGALAAVQGELGGDETEAASENLWGDAEESPEDVTLREFDSATVQRLITQMPEPFREAIVLREINGMSYRDISEVIGVPIGTVMSRLARARALLRAAWVADEGQRHDL